MAISGSSLHLNHSKLSDIGKLSVKSHFITHNSYKAMASECTTHGFHRVRKKLQKKADLPSSKEIQRAEGKCIGLPVHFCKFDFVSVETGLCEIWSHMCKPYIHCICKPYMLHKCVVDLA